MALQNFNYDMDIIAMLPDEPNDVGGLTAAELKAKFDEGGKAIQGYINDTLVPHITALDKSAYEAAIEHGYTGTEDEFYDQLANVGSKADAPQSVSITINAGGWEVVTDGFRQIVTVPGGGKRTLVSLQPTPAQIISLTDDGVIGLLVNNDNGTFYAYVVGSRPSETIVMQAILEEVAV